MEACGCFADGGVGDDRLSAGRPRKHQMANRDTEQLYQAESDTLLLLLVKLSAVHIFTNKLTVWRDTAGQLGFRS